MNVCVICTIIFLSLILKPFYINGDNVGNCTISGNSSGILPRISSLLHQKFQIVKDEYSYHVSICGDVGDQMNVSVTQESPDKKIVVLGRRNVSDIVGGSSWILLTYGGGDQVSVPCTGLGRTEIIITCSNVSKPTLELRDVAKKHGGSEGCFFMFDLVMPPFPNCTYKEQSSPKAESLSNGSVFCIIFLTSFGVYLCVGIFYRRVVKGAKGFEQIPHADFWRRLGNLQADGCDFACRWGDRREESWQRLTNNFNDVQDDRDDALLRP